MSVSLIDGHIDDDAPRMTDNEIIKALECLAYHKECPESEVCQYYIDNGNMCDNISLAKDTLDLINRKNAEIEKREHLKEAVFRMIRYTDRLIECEKLYDDETARYAFNKAREYFKEQVGEV